LGGEEFAIIFPQTRISDALQVLERIRVAIEKLRIAKFEQARITVSIGVTELSKEESSAELLKHADRALYLAKEQGRNCIVTD
jgi:diguanylate cyclase (GGDEF)-like protein